MSEVIISAATAKQIVDWAATPLAFHTKKSSKGSDNKPYSTTIQDAITQGLGAKLTVKAGTYVGKKEVAIYLQCEHKVSFECSMKRALFVPKKDLKFTIFRSQDESCACRE